MKWKWSLCVVHFSLVRAANLQLAQDKREKFDSEDRKGMLEQLEQQIIDLNLLCKCSFTRKVRHVDRDSNT